MPSVRAATIAVTMLLSLVIALGSPFRVAGQRGGERDEIAGEYSVAITREDVPADLAGGPSLIGKWRISFGEDGNYTVRRQDVGDLITGTYEIEGDQITITDEGGILSCAGLASATGTAASATYAWDRVGTGLSLTPVEEGCAPRRLLLATRDLGAFVACLTGQGGDADAGVTTPPATPDADDPLDALAEEVGRAATPDADEEATQGEPDPDNPEAAIDELLSQLTACWASGDPANVLPLFSEGLRRDLVQALGPDSTEADLVDTLTPFLAVPITWERAGDLDLEDEDRASAVVAVRIDVEEEFQTLEFVYEDGAWRLATFFAE
ncbi:MAG: lipocalin family protein [Chloroflexota bacterium]|nr:lipocalin family protein [Chloroflexota bacterium]